MRTRSSDQKLKRARLPSDDGDDERGPSTRARRSPPPSTFNAENLVRSPDIWLKNGTVILHAENTLFKVYEDFLALHSGVFSGMSKMAQPEGCPTLDGCPVVTLYGDSAEDVKHMLLALLYRGYHGLGSDRVPFEVVAAMLRMGRKYGIEILKLESLKRLKEDIPSSLDDCAMAYDHRWRRIVPLKSKVDMFVTVANLLSECAVEAALPYTYLRCVGTLPLDDVAIGRPAKIKAPLTSNAEAGPSSSKSVILAPNVLRICIAGFQRLLDNYPKSFSWVDELGSNLSSCYHPDRCDESRKALQISLFKPKPNFLFPLFEFEEFLEAQEKRECGADFSRLCNECRTTAEIEFEAERLSMWDALPSFFGLADWERLEWSSNL